MAVTIPTATANPAGAASTPSVTYAGLSTGAAANDKLVILCVGKEISTFVLSSVTIDDGVSGVRSMNLINGTTFANMGVWMYRAAVDGSSTTATFVVTFDGNVGASQNHVAVYVLSDAAAPESYSGTDTSTDMDATSPLTMGSTTIATGGGMLAVAVGDTDANAKAWSNLTEDIDADVGLFRFTTAFSTTAGTATRTCQGTANGEDGVLVWAHFTDSSEPELNMMRYRPA